MRRVLKRPKHDHYALAPALAPPNQSPAYKKKESKSIDITSVDKFPDTIPEGKEVANHQTSLFFNGSWTNDFPL